MKALFIESFKVSPFRKAIDKLFASGQKYKDEGDDVMQLLINLIMNSLYGAFLRRDILESYECESEAWMMSEYDERVLDYQKFNHGKFIVKLKDDDGLQDEVKKSILPLQLNDFILSNSKRIMKHFIHAIDGFHTNDVYYTDTVSLYTENKQWDKLDKTGLVGKNLLQRKNEYKLGGIWYRFFLAPRIEYCLTINKFGIIDEHKTFKGFTKVSVNFDGKEYFNKAEGGKMMAKVQLSWKKSFSQGVVVPHKMKNCTNCKKIFSVINVIN